LKHRSGAGSTKIRSNAPVEAGAVSKCTIFLLILHYRSQEILYRSQIRCNIILPSRRRVGGSIKMMRLGNTVLKSYLYLLNMMPVQKYLWQHQKDAVRQHCFKKLFLSSQYDASTKISVAASKRCGSGVRQHCFKVLNLNMMPVQGCP
jgi:hypothetical protein